MSLTRAVSDLSIEGSANGGTSKHAGEESMAVDRDEVLGVAHVEVRLKPSSILRFETIRQTVLVYIQEQFTLLEVGAEVEGWQEVSVLARECDKIRVTDCTLDESFPQLDTLELQIHIYQTSAQTVLEEFAATLEDDDNENEQVMAASVRELPSRELDGLWDNLIYPDDIKARLLNYIYSTLLFSDADVDFDVITWNRVVLLHGPPGTGKTSLCRALAQKLSIRLSNRYSHGKVIEINAHSLFSKWFSESGKLVQKLFSTVTEMVEDESGFVVVLIDEVESLTAARAGAMAGSEPSDALRVVNALLTQLDKLKHRKNVLIMATSNIAQAIDSAFVDRADIKQYIGLPPPEAIYWILSGCLSELMRAGLIDRVELATWKEVAAGAGEYEAQRLVELSKTCNGMSGRTLRRLPVLAHARHIAMGPNSRSVTRWIDAISRVVKAENEQLSKIEQPVAAGSV